MEGLFNHYGQGQIVAQSAGTKPSKVNPFAIAAMTEIGIDISHHRSKSIEKFQGQQFDLVITVCDSAKETCPFFPGKKVIHKSFEDPAAIGGGDEKKLTAFREVRDEELNWIKNDLDRWMTE